jgi:predicted nuclease of predicted toxin-antitoxin system
MNFLADENIDQQMIDRLRNDGHSVLYVFEMDPGISDDQVLELAKQSNALLMTGDTDFGELVYRLKKIHTGVLLIRLAGLSPIKKSEIISSAIASHGEEFLGKFTVISPGMIRIRKN